jgi:ankyrin repeat protein
MAYAKANRRTPLHYAHDTSITELVYRILSPSSLTVIDDFIVFQSQVARGAAIDAQDNFGWTPLHVAIQQQVVIFTMMPLLISRR